MRDRKGSGPPGVAMAIGAHPDDIEFMMAGTLILLGSRGWVLHCMHVADGSCGSSELGGDEIAAVRRAEAEEGARRMGAAYHPPIAEDLAVFYDRPTLAALAAVIRQVAPDILLIPSPEDYMEDHTNTSRLAVTAAFARGMRNFATLPPRAPVDNDVTVYHALPYGLRDPLRQRVRPQIYVDISEPVDRKRHALQAHESQSRWLDASQGVGSYDDTMVAMAAEAGRMSGQFRYAEGWRRHLHLGLAARDADPLVTALGGLAAIDPTFEAGFNAAGAEERV